MIGSASTYSSQSATKVMATGSSSLVSSANIHRLGGEREGGSGSQGGVTHAGESGRGRTSGSGSAFDTNIRLGSDLISSTQDSFTSSTAGNAAVARMRQLQTAGGLDIHHSQKSNNSNINGNNNGNKNGNFGTEKQLWLDVSSEAAGEILGEMGSKYVTTDFQSNLTLPSSTYDSTRTEIDKDEEVKGKESASLSNIPVAVTVPVSSLISFPFEKVILSSDSTCLEEECSDSRIQTESLMNDDKENIMDVETEIENLNEIRMMKVVEMETENVHLEYISRKVLQLLDDVMSTAAHFDSSAPIERMNMMRDGLALLLQRDSIEMTGPRSCEKNSETEFKNTQERIGYDAKGAEKKVEEVRNIKRVSDLNDTMQLLMTIIANAKVRKSFTLNIIVLLLFEQMSDIYSCFKLLYSSSYYIFFF